MFYDSLIVFPPRFNGYLKHDNNKTGIEYRIRYVDPPDGWSELTKSIPIKNELYDQRMIRGDICIATGWRNRITVLECASNQRLPANVKTIEINTRESNLYIFNYESCLSNIHQVMDGINIINDGKFITFDYTAMCIDQDRKIISIPKEILTKLLIESQNHTYGRIDEKMFELLMLLPDEWFNKNELMSRVVLLIRNTVLTAEMRKATLTKLIVERSYTFNADDVDTFLSLHLNSIDKKYNLVALMKKLDDETVCKILLLQKNRKESIQQMIYKANKQKDLILEYEQDSLVKLSDIKSIDSSFNTKKILAMDSRFEQIRMNVCKACKNLHKRGCCVKYLRRSSTTAVFIKHAKIVS